MGAPRGVPHRIAPLKERTDRLAATKRDYPSTGFDADDWYRVLSADDALFTSILGDIARFTRQKINRGQLHLDDQGHEISREAAQ